MNGFARRWWVDLPRALGRRWVGVSMLAADGYVLVGLGGLAGALPIVALGGGLYAGVAHPGFEATFTESLPLVITALVVGTISTQLAMWGVMGFAVGDFFLDHTSWATRPDFGEATGAFGNPLIANLVIERVPLLIQYALLAALVVAVPLGARALAGSIATRLRLPEGVHLVVTAVLTALTAFVLARFWSASAPLVIRPVFTWGFDGLNQGVPPVGAIEPLQANETWIARAAVLAVLGRALLTWLLSRGRPGSVVAEAEVALLAPIERRREKPSTAASILQALVLSAVGVLFLAGMIDDLWAAGVLAAVLFVAQLVKTGLVPIPTQRWRVVVNRIPVLVRFGATLLVMNGVAKAMIDSSLNEGDRFQFFIWPVAIGALLMAILMPQPRDVATDQAPTPSPPQPPPQGQPA